MCKLKPSDIRKFNYILQIIGYCGPSPIITPNAEKLKTKTLSRNPCK
jgi:hypothetical protein